MPLLYEEIFALFGTFVTILVTKKLVKQPYNVQGGFLCYYDLPPSGL